MIDRENPLALQARFVFPVDSPPIAHGVVTISGGRVVAVGCDRPDCAVRDLGNAAIIPGLVNAHTHLEFSDLAAPLGQPGMPLTDWIRHVMAHRRDAVTSKTESVARGLAESLRAGTTTLGEIATRDWRGEVAALPAIRPWTVIFHEAIAPTTDRVAAAQTAAEQFLRNHASTAGFLPGLSPHAPYTVHPKLMEALVELSCRLGGPLAMHLAESREELELLESRSGAFRSLLKDLNAWEPRGGARYATILEYLEHLARGRRALVIHGNYLSEAEWAFMARRRTTMSVVYCPRTHHFFRHEPYPLARALAAGVNVALGTDSRASNPDLSLFEEMRFVAAHHSLSPARVIELGTRNGAKALGLDDAIGTLAPGKIADLTVIRLVGDAPPSDPHELLWALGTHVAQTWHAGRLAYAES